MTSTFVEERDKVVHDLRTVIGMLDEMYDMIWEWSDERRTLIVESVVGDLYGLAHLLEELARGILESDSAEALAELRKSYSNCVRAYINVLRERYGASDDLSSRHITDLGSELVIGSIAQRVLQLLEARVARV